MPLTYRQAVKLIKQNGGKFTAHGKEHDEFTMPWGTKIYLPRHKKTFSPGVENDIGKRALGIKRDIS